MMSLMGQINALSLLQWATSLASSALIVGAVFRAVLEPQNRRWFFLRLGRQEFWLALCLWFTAPSLAAAPVDAYPDVAAAYWVEVDGEAVWAGQPDRPLPMASLAKLMTALVLAEGGGLDQVVTVGAGNYLPWVEAAYEEAGEELPALISDPEGGATVPYEEFIEAEPDLILAPYSGLTEEQYDTLSEIAPVVAYPEAPWTTPWDQTIRIAADALGRADEGEAVLQGISDGLAEQAAAHPEFEGTTFAGVWDGDGFVYVYTAADSRIEVLTELGLEVAPSVSELDTSDGGFFYELSYEQLDRLEADVIVSYHNTREEAEAFLAKPELQAIPAVAAGNVAQVYDPVTVSSVSPPTALSFDWEGGLPTLIEAIAGAVGR